MRKWGWAVWAAAATACAVAGVAGSRLAAERRVEAQDADAERLGPLRGDDYSLRLTYPTGHFDPAWLLAARKQDAAIARATPAGVRPERNRLTSALALDPNAFTPLGPQPLNNAQMGYGHVAGRVNVIAVDPVDPSVAYLGSDGGGVWKTTTCCGAGTTWRVTTDFPEIASTAIDDIAIDPNDHRTVYAATGDLNYGSYSFGAAGVLKSTDQGETWTLLGADVFTPHYAPTAYPQYQAVGKIVVDPNDSQRLVAGTKTGLYFSYDAGASWSGPCYTNPYSGGAAPQRQDITGLLAVNQGGSTTLYAAVGARGLPTPVQPDLGNIGANGVYSAAMLSAGCPAVAAWTLRNAGWPAGTGNGDLTGKTLGRIELAVAPSNPQVLYAEAASSTARNVLGVWRSADGGATWTQTTTSSGVAGCESSSAGGGTQMWYDAHLLVHPTDPNTVWLSGFDLYRSSNGGASFSDVTCGWTTAPPGTINHVHVDHHAAAFVGGDAARLLIGSDGGVFYSANATAANPGFTQLNDSLNTVEIYSGDIGGSFATAATPAAAGGFQDNGSGVVSYGGAPGAALWTSVGGGDGMFSRIEPVKGKNWYASVYYGQISRSTTGPTGSYAAASGAWGAGSSGQGCTSGDERKSFLMPFDLYRYGDTAVAGSGCDAVNGCTRLIAGTCRVWESLTGGSSASWAARTGDLTKGNLVLGTDNRSYINQIHYAFSDPGVAIAGTSDGNVQYVYGLGLGMAATAVNVTGGNAVLPNRPVLNVATDPVNPWIGYAALGGFDQNTPATPGHVFRVTCSTQCASFAWEDKTGNLPNIPVGAVLPNPNYPQQVFAGTDWGLYFTNDITAPNPVWYRFAGGLPHAMVWDLVIDRGYTTLAVFTRSRGAWVWPLPSAPVDPGVADVAVELSAPASVQPGRRLTYQVTVHNAGPSAAVAVSVDAPGPAGLTWAGNSGDCSSAFPCAFPSIEAGGSRTIAVTACVPAGYAGDPAVLQAVATSATGDAVTANNTATLDVPRDLGVLYIDGFDACP